MKRHFPAKASGRSLFPLTVLLPGQSYVNQRTETLFLSSEYYKCNNDCMIGVIIWNILTLSFIVIMLTSHFHWQWSDMDKTVRILKKKLSVKQL